MNEDWEFRVAKAKILGEVVAATFDNTVTETRQFYKNDELAGSMLKSTIEGIEPNFGYKTMRIYALWGTFPDHPHNV